MAKETVERVASSHCSGAYRFMKRSRANGDVEMFFYVNLLAQFVLPLTSTAGSFLAGRVGDRFFIGNSNVADPERGRGSGAAGRSSHGSRASART